VIEVNTASVRSLKADLEMTYIDEYLHEQGYSMIELQVLPEQEATRLRAEACLHAAYKLEELESQARFRTKIHNVTDSL